MAELKVYTLDEVCDILKVTKRTIYSYIKADKLHAVKTGKYWRVSEENLKAFIETGMPVLDENRRKGNREGQAMADFRFKHSNTEHTYYSKDGKSRTYKVCDICGAEQQNNYGLEVSHARRGAGGSYRLGLCGKCANKILPILEGALDEIHATVNELRNDYLYATDYMKSKETALQIAAMMNDGDSDD